MTLHFTPAARRKSRLRMALSGPSGSGKTYSALLIAAGIGGRIAVLDTEHGSASLYSHLLAFDTLELEPPYSPERYIEAIKAAEAAGYETLVIDSITHEWKGSGGMLEIVDKLTAASASKNSYMAWGKADPRHRAFIDAMLQTKLHIIATMRSKTSYVETERNGKKGYAKAGMAPEQRDGVEYEFTAVLDLNNEGNLAVSSKDRTGLFAPMDPFRITQATGQMLRDWLESGADPLPVVIDAPPGRLTVDDAIDNLRRLDDRALILILRDTVKAVCQEAADQEGYARFIEAMHAHVASLTAKAA